MDNLDSGQFRGAWVWKANAIPKIKCFIWQCCHESILVRAVLAKRGILDFDTCPLCNNYPETIDHLLRSCTLAKSFWESISPPMQANYFYGMNFMDWLRLNVCSVACYGSLGIDWSIVFSIGLWCLWIRRNRVVSQKAKPSLNLKVEVLAKATEYVFVGANVHSAPTKSTIQVKWLQLPVNWFKVNSDGSSLGNLGRAGGVAL
ncbi:putative ribonuclease h protein [Quercus suber]|uniref:Ribonuclease h protein n=1 Tax=Quercus suber TaxID=58331 RepID=A0AAW0JND3_QUESU